VDSDDSEALEEAYDMIYEAIEEDGPFDGILGFSQGATLAFQFLVEHAKRNPYEVPGEGASFRCAVFICGMPPFRMDYGDSSRCGSGFSSGSSSGRESPSGCEGVVPSSGSTTSDCGSSASGSLEEAFPRAIFDEGVEQVVKIPTVHIAGKEDDIFEFSLQLYGLCEKETAKLITHAKGHEVPQDRKGTAEIANAVKDLSYRIMFG
jgi:hypothetical protein